MSQLVVVGRYALFQLPELGIVGFAILAALRFALLDGFLVLLVGFLTSFTKSIVSTGSSSLPPRSVLRGRVVPP